MTFSGTSAVYAVNSYVWAVLKEELGWTKVNNKVPVIPADQQPEFVQYDKPFLVYGTASEWPGPMWWIQNEQCAYTIYSSNVNQINDAVRHLNETFIRMDESARDLNEYKRKLEKWYNDLSTPQSYFADLHFKSVEIVSSQGAGALEEEGGRRSGLVVIRYKYTTRALEDRDERVVPELP